MRGARGRSPYFLIKITMKIAVYSHHGFEKDFIEEANSAGHDLCLLSQKLTAETVNEAKGCTAIVIFSSDKVSKEVLGQLKKMEVQLIVTRSAGTDHIDLEAAEAMGLKVANVPSYSPYAIAEHTLALALALLRKLKPSFARTSQYNFDLNGLVGTEIYQKTFGVCGTGDIGKAVAKIAHGFGAKVLLFDEKEDDFLAGVGWASYTSKSELLGQADIISLNLPLNEGTHNFISADSIQKMKDSAILVNTGRGGLVDTTAVHQALTQNNLAGYGMDVYEDEKGIFYKDRSSAKEKDPLLVSLIAMDNVVVTAHQAFLTRNALRNMMGTVFQNLNDFSEGRTLNHLVSA